MLRIHCAIHKDAPIFVPNPCEVEQDGWSIKIRPTSGEPIRRTMASMPRISDLSFNSPIILALGDPTRFSDPNTAFLSPPRAAVKAVEDAAASFSNIGYCQSSGSENCRRAVARYLSEDLPYGGLQADDIFVTAGCSQSIQFCIAALTPGGSHTPSNVLIPKPGFPLYRSVCNLYGVESREYDLIPERGWNINLQSLKQQADRNTVAIVICNPGNPCGSVYSYHHLKQIAEVAKELRVPIISDEIYANMVFDSDELPFIPMGAFAPEAPVLAVGGLSKRWFAPGWRLGWISVCDHPSGILKKSKVSLLRFNKFYAMIPLQIHEAFRNLSDMQLSLANPLQAALPAILEGTPNEFFKENMKALAAAADLSFQRARSIRGLSCPSKPRGSMYIMVRLDLTTFKDLEDDLAFAKALVTEESLTVLPGSAFGYPGWVRLLLAAPIDILEEAWDRIQMFCDRHS